MPILTNKPSTEEKEKFKFHMVDKYEPGQYSPTTCVKDFRDTIVNSKPNLIIEGGSGFLLSSIFNP